MSDRYIAAYNLIENNLRRRGIVPTDLEIWGILEKMPLPHETRLAIIIAPLVLTQDASAWPERIEWRARSLASNPFA